MFKNKTFKGRKIFISGGAGVIGKTLVEKLLKLGAVIFTGDLKPRPEEFPSEVIFRKGDLNCIQSEELLDFKPEVFFHLAATFERTTETYDFWEENYWHNIRLSNHLVNCLKDSSFIKSIVFASSYLIYDPSIYLFQKPPSEPISLDETDCVKPRNLCGAAKMMHEEELKFIYTLRRDPIQIISARIFRVYGKNSNDIISRWIRQSLMGGSLEVYNREGMFDYIYSEEVAEGLLRLCKSGKSGVFNLGNGEARSIDEVLNILKIHFPYMKEVELNNGLLYEASKANMNNFWKATGWLPKKRLEDAIPEIIEYEKRKR